MPKISLLEDQRRQVEDEIARLVEIDITAALAGQPILHSSIVIGMVQDCNILNAAIERLRNAG